MKKNSPMILADNMSKFVYDLAEEISEKLNCKVIRAFLSDIRNINIGIDIGTEFEYKNLFLKK